MPVQRDFASSTNGNSTSITYGVTVANNPNRILLVALSYDAVFQTPTVAYNGASMTLLTNTQWGGGDTCNIYYLLNPDIGTYNVVVSMGSAMFTNVGVACYYNVQQRAPSYITATGASAAPSVTVNNLEETGLAVAGVQNYDQTASVNGANQSMVTEQNVAGQSRLLVAESDSGTTSEVLNYTLPSSSNWAITAVALLIPKRYQILNSAIRPAFFKPGLSR
jgi:hypothetical protein